MIEEWAVEILLSCVLGLIGLLYRADLSRYAALNKRVEVLETNYEEILVNKASTAEVVSIGHALLGKVDWKQFEQQQTDIRELRNDVKEVRTLVTDLHVDTLAAIAASHKETEKLLRETVADRRRMLRTGEHSIKGPGPNDG
jgi:hypothetical protein